MKLYSIWWEEEIALMCSCNDCSKKKIEEGERIACLLLHANLLKEIKALKVRFSVLCSPSSPHPTHAPLNWLRCQPLAAKDWPRKFQTALTCRGRWCHGLLIHRGRLSFCQKKKKNVNAFGDEEWGLMFEGSTQLLVEHEKVAVGGTCLLFLALHISQTLFGKG